MSVPPVAGTPSQSAEVFSSWHDAEQPSPLIVPPSSHSSAPLARPSPQTAGMQLAGASASLACTFPISFFLKVVKLPQ